MNAPRVSAKFEAQDVWIGVFWSWHLVERHIYICLVPCLPIHIEWERRGGYGAFAPGNMKAGGTRAALSGESDKAAQAGRPAAEFDAKAGSTAAENRNAASGHILEAGER